MKNENIDGLLKIVSHSLIAGYEKQNKVNLIEINQEYKKVCHENPFIMLTKAFKIEVTIIIISLIVYLVSNWFNRTMFGLVVVVIVNALVFLYAKFVVHKKIMKVSEILSRCEPKLEAFRTAVRGLLDFNNEDEYITEDFVQDKLVSQAIRVLQTEQEFETVRLQKKVSLSDMLRLGKILEDHRKKFENKVQNTLKFGMKFNKKELFSEAQRYIDRMNIHN